MSTDQDSWSLTECNSHAALLYGEIAEGETPCHVQTRFGQEVYETLQLHIYMTELLRVREDEAYTCWSPGFGLLWGGLEVVFGSTASGLFRKPAPPRVEEIGSTLFATIDKLVKLHDRHCGSFNLDKVRFLGSSRALFSPALPKRCIRQSTSLMSNIGLIFRLRHRIRWRDLIKPPHTHSRV